MFGTWDVECSAVGGQSTRQKCYGRKQRHFLKFEILNTKQFLEIQNYPRSFVTSFLQKFVMFLLFEATKFMCVDFHGQIVAR